jgi:hypothetical protein
MSLGHSLSKTLQDHQEAFPRASVFLTLQTHCTQWYEQIDSQEPHGRKGSSVAFITYRPPDLLFPPPLLPLPSFHSMPGSPLFQLRKELGAQPHSLPGPKKLLWHPRTHALHILAFKKRTLVSGTRVILSFPVLLRFHTSKGWAWFFFHQSLFKKYQHLIKASIILW